jgi:hypothetical protein
LDASHSPADRRALKLTADCNSAATAPVSPWGRF